MSHYPDARKHLGEDIASEYGRAYAVVLGNMVGLRLRAANFPKTKQKSLLAETAGMRRALLIILGVDGELSEENASAVVKLHVTQWEAATAEDEEAMESAS
ncbi:hypothetical protein ACFUN8_35850 [Streptomyces sp. NPDC057307]|uniref:hypothetical protein n=1 Tax=Streptomyces sp. NPDC057307 TaxID=3346096 RepID=UPI00362CAA9F